MGLDVSHDAWHGPYSQFMRWRIWLAKQIGIPLRLMNGFFEWEFDESDVSALLNMHWNALWEMSGRSTAYYDTLRPMFVHGAGIGWEAISDQLKDLLNHSDCGGKIPWWKCKAIALRLLEVYRKSKDSDVAGHGPNVHSGCYDSMRAATLRFAAGCARAWKSREHLMFY